MTTVHRICKAGAKGPGAEEGRRFRREEGWMPAAYRLGESRSTSILAHLKYWAVLYYDLFELFRI